MHRATLILILAAGLAGCSHGQVQLNGGAISTSSGGSSFTSSSAGVNVQANGSTAAALIGLGIAAAIVSGSEAPAYGMRYNMNPFMAVTGTQKTPELAPVRTVNEQDCTQPLADSTANLKCR